MKRFFYASCLFLAIIPLETKAQFSEGDALRYSQDILGGDARYAAMGGAFCAVGGDLSTLAYNPAGIAVFNKSQIEITPGLTLQSTNANYNGASNVNEASSINLQNIGIVGTWKVRKKDKDDEGGWKSYNFGFAYNRLNNFNDNITIQGKSNNSTMLDPLTSAANGTSYTNLEPFLLSPAFNSGLLDTLPGTNASQYFNIIQSALNSGNGYYIQQTENITTTGSMGEFDFSFGGNYGDKLFIGGTFGIVNLNYSGTDAYTETAEYTDATYGFQNYSYIQNVTTSGTGYNFKLGFIYRLMDWLRVGGAINSPTFFNMNNSFSTEWTANYGPSPYSGPDGTQVTGLGSQINYNSSLTTPLKAIGGAAAIINNQGIVSVDYEYVNYSTISINSSDLGPQYTAAVNSEIGQDFIQASNLKFGFEWVLYPVSFRLGYDIYGNPYNQGTVGFASVRNTYSAGIGLKVNNAFFDLAYTLMQYNEQPELYSGSNPTTLKTNITNVMFTLGYNFGTEKHHAHRGERFNNYPPPPPPPPPAGY